MRYLFISLVTITIGALANCSKPSIHFSASANTLKAKAREAHKFCKENNMNQDFSILIDMSIHSGKKRLFIYDFNKNKIIASYLVSHGCCESPWTDDQTKTSPTFSNVPNSHCSSLGKYKLGERGWSSYGINIKYLLIGLESSNNNALKRDVVFHSWDLVGDDETYPQGTPEGWGCPAVSNNAFREIDRLLQSSNKSTLMWIFK